MEKTLKDIKILITRSQNQSLEFYEKLIDLGSEVINIPFIEITPIINNDILLEYKNIDLYNWIIFTSTNSVEIFFKVFEDYNISKERVKNIKFAVVGKKTDNKLNEYGFHSSIIPKDFTADFLLKEFIRHKINNQKILIPTSKIAKKDLYNGLLELGNNVIFLPIYENIKPDINYNDFDLSNIDYVTFTSPSTVENFYSAFKKIDANIVCIGTVTAEKIQSLFNIKPLVPKEFTIDGMIEEIIINEKRRDIV